jgi:hypothetical protein
MDSFQLAQNIYFHLAVPLFALQRSSISGAFVSPSAPTSTFTWLKTKSPPIISRAPSTANTQAHPLGLNSNSPKYGCLHLPVGTTCISSGNSAKADPSPKSWIETRFAFCYRVPLASCPNHTARLRGNPRCVDNPPIRKRYPKSAACLAWPAGAICVFWMRRFNVRIWMVLTTLLFSTVHAFGQGQCQTLAAEKRLADDAVS